MKFDEKKLELLERSLGLDFFKAFGDHLSEKMRVVERNHQSRMMKLAGAYAQTNRLMTI